MHKVDIIILSWDRTDDTLEAIRSAIEQDGIDHRVIVVDQGSKPENLQRLRTFCAGYEQVDLICNTKNNGVAGGRNQASAAGSGQFIVALDNDAVFAHNRVCKQAAGALAQDPGCAGIAMRIDVFESPQDAPIPDASSWVHEPREAADWFDYDFACTRFVGAGHMLRRDIFEQVGAYDERLFFMHEEGDLSARMLNAGYTFSYRGAPAIRHKVSPEHRVHWQSGRYRFHVRNLTYQQVKQHGVKLHILSDLMVRTISGVRAGLAKGALQGFFEALWFIPGALHERRTNPYYASNAKADTYRASVLDAAGEPRQRIDQSDAEGRLAKLISRIDAETEQLRELTGS